MEVLLLLVVLLMAVVVVLRGGRSRQHRYVELIVAGMVVLAVWRGVVWYSGSYEHHQAVTHVAHHVPAQSTDHGHVSSRTCKICHAEHYHSWHKTYHRTMTQAASPQAVLGDFDGVELTRVLRKSDDQALVEQYHLEQRGEAFWARLLSTNDPAATREVGVMDVGRPQQIVMTTGSHHYQLYWTSPDSDRMQYIFPFAYLLADERWVQRESALLMPPQDAYQGVARWNELCIRCHSTHSQPRVTIFEDRPPIAQTRVAELGISCEACHGPGETHVRVNQSPLRRYRQQASDVPDPTIINPKRLSADRASQICGQCHAIPAFIPHDWDTGHWNRYQPGGDLDLTRTIVRPNRPETLSVYELLGQSKEDIARIVDDRFWSDGMVRVSGREFNGMTESKCYTHGAGDRQISCLSCHSMHQSDPDDQLAAGMHNDRACFQCHEKYAKNIEQHTHHAADSSGSRCYNCHMPHTTYGLLKAIRSHQIDSPTVASTLQTGRPNACNACHLDKTLQWTQDHLTEWYDTPPVQLSEDEKTISATLLAALRGDAGQRALAAWAMGWETAKRPSGDSWIAPYLAEMLNDDYTAVRYIAARSLRRVDEYRDFPFDFVGPPEHRVEARQRALAIWQGQGPARAKKVGRELLINADGQTDRQTIERLMQDPNRNKRVDLKE